MAFPLNVMNYKSLAALVHIILYKVTVEKGIQGELEGRTAAKFFTNSRVGGTEIGSVSPWNKSHNVSIGPLGLTYYLKTD